MRCLHDVLYRHVSAPCELGPRQELGEPLNRSPCAPGLGDGGSPCAAASPRGRALEGHRCRAYPGHELFRPRRR